jgi:hypothetical protein
MSEQSLELGYRRRIWQRPQADGLVLRSLTLAEEQASFLKLLVEKGRATDHGAALAPRAVVAFTQRTPAGPLEETSMT